MARAPAKKKDQLTAIEIIEISRGTVEFPFVGTSELIFNRMADKAKRTLLMGGGRKNAAEKAANVKHDPVAEFRSSVYRNPGDKPATRLRFPAPGLKGTIKTAALDMPGATKAEMGRRVWVPGTHIDIYGIPKLVMSVVRSADVAKTPDIRTRAIVPQWCGVVTFNFARPLVTDRMIGALFAAGGILCGIGDWRQEKGSGSFGQFRICEKSDPEFKHLIATSARVAQDKALQLAECFDEETQELLDFYNEEIIRRGRDKKTPVNDDEELPEAAD